LGSAKAIGVETQEVAMVAAHLADLKSARDLGFRTIYVERKQEEDWDPQETHIERQKTGLICGYQKRKTASWRLHEGSVSIETLQAWSSLLCRYFTRLTVRFHGAGRRLLRLSSAREVVLITG